ncbi:MAG: methyltransferase domain-containing protein [Actinomycetota bacterium]|nr:methyltransferase domain-containing protein [Actinomycetota bacterium]MDQ3719918.1 methyltransferase domain-containing protein [Actinomycetota bacterium]
MSAVPFQALLEGQDAKGCCASLYEAEPVRWLLGGELHPGGERLTRRTAELADLGGARVVDVASGAGASAQLLAGELGAEVVGVELGAAAVQRARAAAHQAGLGERVSFREGDAEALPLPDASVDAALCECSLCVFPSKATAVAEMARVVRPGGVLAISDVVADVQALPPSLRSPAARVACVADALSEPALVELLEHGGLELIVRERHDAELAAMIDRVEARLRVARMLAVPALESFRGDIAAAVELARAAKEAVADGRLGYGIVVARRP